MAHPRVTMNPILKEHYTLLGLGVFNDGGFYKHGVPTGLDAVSLAPPKVRGIFNDLFRQKPLIEIRQSAFIKP